MTSDIQRRIVALRNEIQGQKTFSGLAFSQLLLPENTPTQTYSGTASLSGGLYDPVAKVRFRFTRDDGLIEAPAINFAYECTTSPTYVEFVRGVGFTISGDDLGYFDQWGISGYVSEIGDGYVDFIVAIQAAVREAFFSLNSISFSVTCQAVTNVLGTLIVERIL